MKKKFTLAAVLVFFTLCSYGQKKEMTQNNLRGINRVKTHEDMHFSHGISNHNHKDYKNDLLITNAKAQQLSDRKSAQAVKQRLDSIVEYYDSDDDGYKVEFTYDANGNETQYIYYLWTNISNAWVESFKIDLSYDANGNETQNIFYSWNNISNVWVDAFKIDLSYDANGNSTQEVEYEWDSITNAWFGYSKMDFTYDANRNITQTVSYQGDISTNAWVNEWKRDRIYDSNGNMTQEISNNWDISSNTWGDPYKSDFSYDSNGNKTQVIGSYWSSVSSAWDVNYKYEYSYDSHGNNTLEIYLYWDSNTNAWLESSNKYKTDYTYDVSNNITQERSYFWDSNTNAWAGDQKGGSDYIWDANGNQTSAIYSRWDNTTSQYIPEEKDLSSYDLSYSLSDLIFPLDFLEEFEMKNMILETSTYYWDELSSSLVYEYKVVFYYSEINITSVPKTNVSGIDIYPNPVADYIKVSGFTGLAMFNLYNLQGKLVISKTVSANEQVNVSGLSAGVYAYNIAVDQKQQAGKLIKK